MKLHERTVHYYDLVLSSSTRVREIESPACCDLSALIERLTKLAPKGREISRTASSSIEISDWQYDGSTKVLKVLLNRADRNVSDVSFIDFASKSRRKAGKTRQEGIEMSCHLVIRPNPDGLSALVLLTMGSGITFQTIARAMTFLARVARGISANSDLYYFPVPSGELDKNGKPVTYGVRYSFALLAHKSSMLDDALRNGRFISMELIAHEHSEFDTGGNLQIERQNFFITAAGTKTITGAVIKNAVSNYFRHGPPFQFDNARIAYTGSDGNKKTTTLMINDLDAAFTRRDTITLASAQESQQILISDAIVSEMIKLL